MHADYNAGCRAPERDLYIPNVKIGIRLASRAALHAQTQDTAAVLQSCSLVIMQTCSTNTSHAQTEIQLMYWQKKARVSGWDKSMELFIVFVGSVENIVSVYGPGWHTRRVAVANLISFTHWQHERCSLLLQHLLPHYLQSKHLRKSKYDTSPLNVQFK